MATREGGTKAQYTFRIETALIAEAERVAEVLSERRGVEVTRNDVVREALAAGLRVIEAGETRPAKPRAKR